MKKTLLLLSIGLVATTHAAVVTTVAYDDATGMGSVSAGGAQIATFTVSNFAGTSLFGTDSIKFRRGSDTTITSAIDMTITDANYAVDTYTWQSSADNAHIGAGGASGGDPH